MRFVICACVLMVGCSFDLSQLGPDMDSGTDEENDAGMMIVEDGGTEPVDAGPDTSMPGDDAGTVSADAGMWEEDAGTREEPDSGPHDAGQDSGISSPPDSGPVMCGTQLCRSGESCCGTLCVVVNSDLNNCGRCGNECDMDRADSCMEGRCSCNGGPACIFGICVPGAGCTGPAT